MEKIHYDNLVSNSEITVIGEEGFQFFRIEEANAIIMFYFKGIRKDSQYPSDRIELKAYKEDIFQGQFLLKTIKDSSYIVVNADRCKSAMTFQLLVDYEKRKVIVKLVDEPERGIDRISENEKNGIEIKY